MSNAAKSFDILATGLSVHNYFDDIKKLFSDRFLFATWKEIKPIKSPNYTCKYKIVKFVSEIHFKSQRNIKTLTQRLFWDRQFLSDRNRFSCRRNNVREIERELPLFSSLLSPVSLGLSAATFFPARWFFVVGELHACRTQRAMLRHTTPMERSRWNLQRGESWRIIKRSKKSQ